jgi:hypothetical protein
MSIHHSISLDAPRYPEPCSWFSLRRKTTKFIALCRGHCLTYKEASPIPEDPPTYFIVPARSPCFKNPELRKLSVSLRLSPELPSVQIAILKIDCCACRSAVPWPQPATSKCHAQDLQPSGLWLWSSYAWSPLHPR